MLCVEVPFSFLSGDVSVRFYRDKLSEQKFFEVMEYGARVILAEKADQMFFEVPKCEVVVDLVPIFSFFSSVVNFWLAVLSEQRLQVEQQNGGLKLLLYAFCLSGGKELELKHVFQAVENGLAAPAHEVQCRKVLSGVGLGIIKRGGEDFHFAILQLHPDKPHFDLFAHRGGHPFLGKAPGFVADGKKDGLLFQPAFHKLLGHGVEAQFEPHDEGHGVSQVPVHEGCRGDPPVVQAQHIWGAVFEPSECHPALIGSKRTQNGLTDNVL